MLTLQEIEKNRKLLSETDKSMAATFKVLSNVNRYRIVRILSQQPEISISTLAKILNISLPLASQHVRVLANANLLQKERSGKRIFPKLEHTNPFVQAIVKTIEQARQFAN